MSCCGSHRQTASTIPSQTTAAIHAPVLIYMGATALSILGPATGRAYRFPISGARVRVDPRDAAGLVRHPALRISGTG